MNSRRLTAVLLLLMVLTVGFGSVPVLSGEHPWDSDRTQGEGTGNGDIAYLDTVIGSDSGVAVTVQSTSTPGSSALVNVLTTVWSVSWML